MVLYLGVYNTGGIMNNIFLFLFQVGLNFHGWNGKPFNWN